MLKTLVSACCLLALLAPAVPATQTEAPALAPEPASAAEAAEAAGLCMVCSVQQDYADLKGEVRHEVLNTQHGFLIVTTVLDEALIPVWQEFEQDRDSKRVTAMKLTSESQAERLCWFCQATFALESRDDASVEHLRSSLGGIIVATGSTREAAAALQEYAKLAQNRITMLDEAGYH